MDLGEPKRTVIVKPATIPVQQRERQPEPIPQEEPQTVEVEE